MLWILANAWIFPPQMSAGQSVLHNVHSTLYANENLQLLLKRQI